MTPFFISRKRYGKTYERQRVHEDDEPVVHESAVRENVAANFAALNSENEENYCCQQGGILEEKRADQVEVNLKPSRVFFPLPDDELQSSTKRLSVCISLYSHEFPSLPVHNYQ